MTNRSQPHRLLPSALTTGSCKHSIATSIDITASASVECERRNYGFVAEAHGSSGGLVQPNFRLFGNRVRRERYICTTKTRGGKASLRDKSRGPGVGEQNPTS